MLIYTEATSCSTGHFKSTCCLHQQGIVW